MAWQDGDLLTPDNLNSKGDQVFNVKAYGAVGDGSTNDNVAVAAATAAAVAAGGGTVFFPIGTYKVTGAAPLAAAAGISFVGAHRYKSFIDWYPTAANQAAIDGTGVSNFQVSNLRVRSNGARAINRVSTTLTFSPAYPIHLLNSTDFSILDCEIEWGNWGVFLDNTTDTWTTDDWTTNYGGIVQGCRFHEQATEGLYIRHGKDIVVDGNHFEGNGTDGIKTDRRCRALTITNNISRGHLGDGYDFYDGLIESTVANNIADDCSTFGYEFKGTFGGFDGTATDYVCRDNTVTGNVAVRCSVGSTGDGFNIVSIRNSIFTGNTAILCGGDGFSISNLQNCTFIGCVASKNTQHGFNIFNTAAGNVFIGCSAPDNSWDDGVTQNGTYDGFSVGTGCDAVFIGCRATNSSTSGIRGGMGYGLSFAGTGSNVIGYAFGGTAGAIENMAGNFITGSGSSGAYLETGGGSILGPRQIYPFATLTLNATAPSVAGGNHFLTNSNAARSYVNFSGTDGQRILIFANDANTGITDGATIVTIANANIAAGAWTWIELVNRSDVWYELAHA